MSPVFRSSQKRPYGIRTVFFYTPVSAPLRRPPLGQPLRHLLRHVKARAHLHPLLRFHHPVPVQVRAQVTVSHHLPDSEISRQHPYQHPQRMFLSLGPRIRISSILIQAPFVAHPDTVSVESPGMRPHLLHRPHRTDQTVAADIIMVATPVETPSPVHPVQFLRRKPHLRRSSRTVNHNQINLPHVSHPSSYPKAGRINTSAAPATRLSPSLSYTFLHTIKVTHHDHTRIRD